MPERDYDVGYRRPPHQHRFKPGKSGNPKGRPKGARSLQTEIDALLSAKVTLTEHGKKRKVSVLTAALKRLVHKAVADGDMRAIIQLLQLASQRGNANQAEPVIEAADQAIIAEFLKRHIEEDGQ